MYFIYLGLIFAACLFLLMLGFLELGRKVGKWHIQTAAKEKEEAGVNLAETSVFALMGLLIAFTFAAANTKFDERRQLIIQEANAIETAYLRIDMLAPNAQPTLRDSFRQYIGSRISVYNALPNLHAAKIQLEKSGELQKKLWEQAVNACQKEASPAVCMLFLPAINTMIDISSLRTAAMHMHPPVIVFILLVGLALISAFLAGYSMAKYKTRSSLHVILYAALMVITIYIAIDMEYPRFGLIRLDSFDQFLISVQTKMR